ncbi:MAG: type III secretion system inner membrane ring subunit SctD [Ramlibacter sp.]
MNRDGMSELRILTGTHAGARALLSESAQTLGSGDDCDFILSDDGVAQQHVRVESQQDGTVLLYWLDSDDNEPQRLIPGEGAAVGPVTITVDEASAPWPDAVEASTRLAAAAERREPVARDDALDTAPSGVQAAPVPALPARSTSITSLVLVVLFALLLTVGAGIWWTSAAVSPSPSSAASPAPTHPVPVVNEALRIQREQILAIATKLGMAGRVKVDIVPGGGPLQVRASLLSEEDAEILAMALAGLSPRPALRTGSERDLKLAVEDAVQRHAVRLQTRIAARYLGDGRFSIEGRVPDAAAKPPILKSLRAEFSDARAFEDGLQTSAEQADAMLEDLRRQGIQGVVGQLHEGTLAITVRLSAADVSRWEKSLLAVGARYDVPFKATLDVSADAPRISATLPLHIRSVVSGDAPYVLLADGSRLFVEGQRAGWRLVSIGAQSMVFEGTQAQRVVVDR